MRSLAFVSLFVVASSIGACSSASNGAAQGGGTQNQDADAGDIADAAIDPHILDAGPVTCDAPTTGTHCTDENPDAWVFGIARFNPAIVPDGVTPVLRIALRHNLVE
ncbi:MAG: hypothetical protein ACREJX_01050, partial [Polyangiaceae bacterium]